MISSKTAIFCAIILSIGIGAGIALQNGIYQLHMMSQAIVGVRINKFTGEMALCKVATCNPVLQENLPDANDVLGVTK